MESHDAARGDSVANDRRSAGEWMPGLLFIAPPQYNPSATDHLHNRPAVESTDGGIPVTNGPEGLSTRGL